MNQVDELRLHASALLAAVEQDKKFFASIMHYVKRLNLVVNSESDLTQRELKVLAGSIEGFFEKWRSSGDGFYIPPRETDDTEPTVQEINRIVSDLLSLSEEEFDQQRLLLKSSVLGRTMTSNVNEGLKPCVFVGHGGSKLWARVKVYLEDELQLQTVTYESEPRAGHSIVPVLEKMLAQASFAVLVFTAEDDTSKGMKRARQNVIHEAGLFQGKLGFDRAVLLIQAGVDAFSNIAGLQYLPFSGDNVEQTFYELRRVLQRERLIT